MKFFGKWLYDAMLFVIRWLRIVLALILVGTLGYIYWWHNLATTEVGIEGIKELKYWILLPAVGNALCAIILALRIPQGIAYLIETCAAWMALQALGLSVYLAAVHTGTRQAVSLPDHPMYPIAIAAAALQTAVWLRHHGNPVP